MDRDRLKSSLRYDTHDEHDAGEQQQYLGRVVDEEMHRFAKVCLACQPEGCDDGIEAIKLFS